MADEKLSIYSGNVITELLYTVCIGYAMITMFFHRMTGLPFTGVICMIVLIVADMVKRRTIVISRVNIALICVNFLVLGLSLLFVHGDRTAEYAIDYLAFAFIAGYISEYELNSLQYTHVIRNLAIVYSLLYIAGFAGMMFQEDYFNTSKNIVTGFIALFVVTWNMFRNRFFFRGFVLLAIWISSAFLIVQESSRGVLVSIGLFIFAFIMFKDVPKYVKLMGAALICASIFFVYHIVDFIRFGFNYFQNLGIEVRFFSKSMEKLSTSTLSSHREDIYISFFNSDKTTLIFGRGIGGFEKEFGLYPHNLIISKWSEFGIFGLCWMIFLIVATVMIMKKYPYRRDLLLLVIGGAIFPLMFSFVYWNYPEYFLFEFLIVRFFVGMIEEEGNNGVKIRARISKNII